MAISQQDIRTFEGTFGEGSFEKFSGAITSTEEVALGLRINGKIVSPEEHARIKDEAVKQGKELGYKEIAKNLDITLDAGEKDPLIIATKFKTGVESIFETKYKNQTPTDEILNLAKKATEFEQKYTQLFETHKQKEVELNEWQTKYTEKERAIETEQINNKILSYFPKDMNQDKGDALLIARNAIQFDKDENGQLVAKKQGKAILDPLGNPESIENVVKSFVEEKGWLKTGGMGGQDRNPENRWKGTMTADQARQQVMKEGMQPTSPEGLKRFTELLKK